ncbi:hypothetical protein C366_00321 [Cryptococcus neoformans Tu401-1]|nr:hypothetical protein C366_00321 [Cryptococcus neoformans var. grubii Tu401-1]OXM82211.1 hypothetical protein C364_00323 [Cryptococcus neoformans var. grubii Bt63]
MRYIIIAPLILASIVSAALTITEPSAAHWWVAQSLNTLAWDGTDPTEFSVFLANSDSNVLTSMLALASIVPTYQTSQEMLLQLRATPFSSRIRSTLPTYMLPLGPLK